MIWVLAFAAALMGAVLASEAEALFGFGAGFLIVAALGLLHRQSSRIDALTAQLRDLEARRGLQPESQARPTEAPTPEPSRTVAESTSPAAAAAPEEPPPIPSMVDAKPAAAPSPSPAFERPAPRPAASRAPPVEPDAIERFAARLRAFLFEGNVPVKLGLLVSLFGVAALIR